VFAGPSVATALSNLIATLHQTGDHESALGKLFGIAASIGVFFSFVH
jgi:hypothetical protein